ncbi:MAG: ABC transporter substrate-binding protein [Chloroflexota bacterium]|nr:ABC transporter substrate-binding protein [Chloroflexota bacterium]
MRASFRVAIALLVAVFVASACGGASTGGTGTGGPKPTVKIGSTNFYEQGILAELYAQALENSGYTVERKLNLGSREIVQPALESGQIDIDAEYLATLLTFVDKNAKASTDPKETAKTLQTVLSTKKLTVLDAAAATDQNGFVVTKDTATKYNLKKLSDIASGAAQGQLVLGGPPECPSPQRPFCKPGLEQTYGIKFKDFKPLDAGGPLTVAALDGKQIDIALLFTSDPTIVAKSFVLLDDDKHLQLSDNIAPVVRDDLLTKDDGTIRKVLNSISAKLSQDELNGMNKLVSVDKKDPKDVAKDWLKKQGLIK